MAVQKGSVKGSSHGELIVQPYDPAKAALKRVLYGISLVVIAAACLAIGYYGSLKHISDLTSERDALTESLSRSISEVEDLTRQVGVLSKGEEIDRQAANSVRSTILSLENEVAELQQEVAFYKNIMVPGKEGTGLRIGRMKMTPVEDGKVLFKLVLSQPGNTRNQISGRLSLVLTVSQVDGVADIPFHEMSESLDDSGIFFRFRYFQEVEGTIRLPEDAVPQQIHLVAVTSGKNSQRIEEIIDWPL